MAVREPRSALFLMESDALALEVEDFLGSNGSEWTVMLTRVVDAAKSALLGGKLDLAILIPEAPDTVDDLLDGLRDANIPTIVVTDQGGKSDATAQAGGDGGFTVLDTPVDMDRLKMAVHSTIRDTTSAILSPTA